MDILGAFRAFGEYAAFNGPAAVIVFFVISGFCIHFPNRNGLVVRSWKLYLRATLFPYPDPDDGGSRVGPAA